MIHSSVSGEVSSKKGRLLQCMSSLSWRVFASGGLKHVFEVLRHNLLNRAGKVGVGSRVVSDTGAQTMDKLFTIVTDAFRGQHITPFVRYHWRSPWMRTRLDD